MMITARILDDPQAYPETVLSLTLHNGLPETVRITAGRLRFHGPMGGGGDAELKSEEVIPPKAAIEWTYAFSLDAGWVSVDLSCEDDKDHWTKRFTIDVDVLTHSWAMTGKRISITTWGDESADLIASLSQPLAARTGWVLLLGKDTGPELAQLRLIQHLLRKRGCPSILVKDLPNVPTESLEQKVIRVASQASYTILESSTPAGQIAELQALAGVRTPVAVIRQRGRGATWMQADYHRDFAFIQNFEYDELDDRLLSEIDDWMNGYLRERAAYFDRLFPWRRGSTIP